MSEFTINIIDYNHCNLPDCNCGWNIFLGGTDERVLRAIKKAVKELSVLEKEVGFKVIIKDKTDYKGKINNEKF